MTRKEKLNELGKYFTKKYPDREDWVINTTSFDACQLPSDMTIEAYTFLKALEIGYELHVKKVNPQIAADKEVIKELEKTLECTNAKRGEDAKAFMRGYTQGMQSQANADLKVLQEGYDKGYRKGFIEGGNNAIIPENAYDIEVFAVQPAPGFPSGQQAFIGFNRITADGNNQFSFIQIQYSVTNPNKKYGNKENIEENIPCNCSNGKH